MKKLAILSVLLLGACSPAHDAMMGAAIEARRDLADREARLSLVMPCAMTLGAYFRLPPMQRRAAEALCGGEGFPRKSDTTFGAAE